MNRKMCYMNKRRFAFFITGTIFLGTAVSLYFILTKAPEENPSNAVTVHYQIEGTAEAETSAELQYYLNQNNEVIGLLSIPGTALKTPVVQSNPANYYLRRNLAGEYDSAGVPFVGDDAVPLVGNCTIFGHRLWNETQFGILKFYTDADYFAQHPEIEFEIVGQGKSHWKIISVFTQDLNTATFAYEQYTKLDKTRRKEFLDEIRAESIYPFSYKYQDGDVFLTLSTCEYEVGQNGSGRLAVVAVKDNLWREKQ